MDQAIERMRATEPDGEANRSAPVMRDIEMIDWTWRLSLLDFTGSGAWCAWRTRQETEVEVKFPLHQIRRCAHAPRRAQWHTCNTFETLASVASRLAPGWPLIARLIKQDV